MSTTSLSWLCLTVPSILSLAGELKCVFVRLLTNCPRHLRPWGCPGWLRHSCAAGPEAPPPPPRKIWKWSKCDWDKIRSLAAKFKDSFLEKCMNQSFEENYEEFSNHLDTLMRDHVPSKVINPRFHKPWLNSTIKRMSRKKQRLFNRAKRSNKRSHWDKYKSHKKDTLKAIRRARWSYTNEILQLSLDDNNPKPFWRYVRSQRQDNVGVSALKAGGRLFSDGLTKAE